jgi:hypothetical protein
MLHLNVDIVVSCTSFQTARLLLYTYGPTALRPSDPAVEYLLKIEFILVPAYQILIEVTPSFPAWFRFKSGCNSILEFAFQYGYNIHLKPSLILINEMDYRINP